MYFNLKSCIFKGHTAQTFMRQFPNSSWNAHSLQTVKVTKTRVGLQFIWVHRWVTDYKACTALSLWYCVTWIFHEPVSNQDDTAGDTSGSTWIFKGNYAFGYSHLFVVKPGIETKSGAYLGVPLRLPPFNQPYNFLPTVLTVAFMLQCFVCLYRMYCG